MQEHGRRPVPDIQIYRRGLANDRLERPGLPAANHLRDAEESHRRVHRHRRDHHYHPNVRSTPTDVLNCLSLMTYGYDFVCVLLLSLWFSVNIQ